MKTTGVVNHFYVYAVDDDFGPFFLKFCSYFPYNGRLCVLTELRGESFQFRGQVPVCGGTVPARDRIRGVAAGSCGVGGGAVGGVEGDWGVVLALPAA